MYLKVIFGLEAKKDLPEGTGAPEGTQVDSWTLVG